MLEILTVGSAHLRTPFGYDPEYFNILPFEADAEVSATVGNNIPLIATRPVVLLTLIGPENKEGLTISKPRALFEFTTFDCI